MARPNLTAEIGARATRILIERGRAVGSEIVQGGQTRWVFADAEVLLSAGTVQSPQILQLPGIGDPDALKAAGVDLSHALSGVGANMQGHLDVKKTVSRFTSASCGPRAGTG